MAFNVTSPNRSKRVYPVSQKLDESYDIKLLINTNPPKSILGRVKSSVIDRKIKANAEFKFDRIAIEPIEKAATLPQKLMEIARVKGSSEPYMSSIPLSYKLHGDKKWIVSQRFRMKPAVFKEQARIISKNAKKNNKKSTETKPKPIKSILTDTPSPSPTQSPTNSTSEYSQSPTDSTSSTTNTNTNNNNKNRLQRKRTLNKQKHEKLPLKWNEIKGELPYIKHTLSSPSKIDANASKAMKYITNFEGEYRPYGLEPDKWKFIKEQYDIWKVSKKDRDRSRDRGRKKKKHRKVKRFYGEESDSDQSSSSEHIKERKKKAHRRKRKHKNKRKQKYYYSSSECSSSTSNSDSGSNSDMSDSNSDSDIDVGKHEHGCIICEKVIKMKNEGDTINKHWRRHKNRKKYGKYTCRFNLKEGICVKCGKTFPNEVSLESHIFSQHSGQMLASKKIKNVSCSECDGECKPSWSGRYEKWKKLCLECGKKRVCANKIEEARLNDCILTQEEIEAKYPLPNEKNKRNKNKKLKQNTNEILNDSDGIVTNDKANVNSDNVCVDGNVHKFDLMDKSGCIIWGCTKCGTIEKILKQ